MDCNFYVIAFAVWGAICAIALPIWALYKFAVDHFARED